MLVAWFWTLIAVVSDIFASEDLNGMGKGLWLLGVIVSFYFGARFQAKEQHMLQEMARGMQVKLHHHERDIPSQKVDDPSPIQMSSPTPDSAGNPLENRALSDWHRAKVR